MSNALSMAWNLLSFMGCGSEIDSRTPISNHTFFCRVMDLPVLSKTLTRDGIVSDLSSRGDQPMTRLHAPLGMRTQGDFDRMWSELEQDDDDASALARQSLSCLYAETEPQIECIERDDAYWLIADFPGMHRDDISVDVQDQTLTLRGERAVAAAAAASTLQERSIHAFARRFVLEHPVDADAMTTTYTDGALAVCIPKAIGQPIESPALQIA
jgi:HSP20 family protein